MSILGSTEAIAIDFWQLQGQRVREGATRRAKEAVWQVVGKKERRERERYKGSYSLLSFRDSERLYNKEEIEDTLLREP